MVGLVAYHRADALHNLARPVARPLRRARVEHDDIGHGARFANRSLDSRGAIGHNLHRHEFAAQGDDRPLIPYRMSSVENKTKSAP